MAGLTGPMADPFLEYGRRLQTMGRPMEDLTDEAKKLSDMFGISMSDAIDHIARVKMRELDQEFNLFMENLLAKKQEVMEQEVMAGSVHTAPTDFGGGRGGLPAGLQGQGQGALAVGLEAIMAGGGLPAGLQGQGALSVGLEAIMAGQNPTIMVQTYLDGLQIDKNQGNQGAQNEDTNSGGT